MLGDRLQHQDRPRETEDMEPDDEVLDKERQVLGLGVDAGLLQDLKNLFQSIANERRWNGHHHWQGSYLGSDHTINLKARNAHKTSLLCICVMRVTEDSSDLEDLLPGSQRAVWKSCKTNFQPSSTPSTRA